MKERSRVSVLLGALLLTSLFIYAVHFVVVPTLHGQEPRSFPESHKDFLGGASFMAYFGLIDLPVLPGPGASPPGGTGPPPRVGPNVQVNAPQSPFPDGLLGRSETTIAADRSGRLLLAGWNDAEGFCGPPFNVDCTTPPTPGLSGFGFSSDGGNTWTDAGAPFPVATPEGMKVTRGDPWMDTGGPGTRTYYFANLAVDAADTDPGLGGMVVHRGQFNRQGFTFDNGVFIQSPNAPNDFLDKEALCAGKGGNFRDEVAVTVTNFKEVGGIPFFGFGQIEGYFSNDRAESFPLRTIIQEDETLSVSENEGIVNQGSTCAFGPEGQIYVTWERGFLSPFFGQGAAGVFPQIVIARSDDGGQTFTARQLVSNISSAALFPPGGYNRNTMNDFPRICVAQSGRFKGRVYVTYQDSRIANEGTQAETGGLGHFDADVYVRFSDDGGMSWSDPVLVAGGGDGKIQFWPVVGCQSDGDVDVTWYESEETQEPDFLDGDEMGTSLVDVFYAQSTDGGASFSGPIRITEVTTDWGATATNIVPNFGDYIFHVSLANKVLATWAEGRNGVPDVFYATVKTK